MHSHLLSSYFTIVQIGYTGNKTVLSKLVVQLQEFFVLKKRNPPGCSVDYYALISGHPPGICPRDIRGHGAGFVNFGSQF